MVFTIGQLSKATDCKVSTIRYYEQTGLLPTPERSIGNQRRYNEDHLILLKFIRHARALGFDLEAIKQLQHLSHCNEHSPHEAEEIAKQHLIQVESRIVKLQALKKELNKMIGDCSEHKLSKCRVLEVLADHRLCQTEH